MPYSHKKFSLMALLGVAIALIVAACGSSSATPTPAPTATKAPAATTAPAATVAQPTAAPAATAAQPTATRPAPTATPVPAPTVPPTATTQPVKRGGILRTRIEYTPGSAPHWNLLQGPINSAYPLFEPVLSALVQVDPVSLQLSPDLAASWTISSDGKTYTFKIRPGVTWQDGTPLTARDIQPNWDMMLTSKLGEQSLGFTSHFKALISAVANTRAVDDSTFVITLSGPSNSFFRTMGHALMVNYNWNKYSVSDLNSGKIIGTNAYRWNAMQPNVKVELRSYPGYWDKGADGKALPYLDGIDYNVILDSSLHIAAFRTGQLDVFDHINATALVGQIDLIKKDIPTLQVGAGYDSWRMILVKNKAPFNNINVRKALQIGLDRQAFSDAGLGGAGVASGYSQTPKDFGGQFSPALADLQKFPGMNPAAKAAEIAQAGQLLSSASFTPSNPLAVTMYVVAGGVFSTEAEAAASLLNKVPGLKVTVKTEDSATHNKRLVVPGGDFELIYRPFAQAFDDPSQTVGLFWITTGSRNYGEWSDAQIDQMYKEQESTTDAARRSQVALQMGDRIYDQAFNIVLGWSSTPWVKRGDIVNYYPGGSFSNRGRFDRTWINR